MATKLTNTQIQTLVNNAYNEAVGTTSSETMLDITDFCERGTAEIGADLREKFFGKLLGVITKNWYVDSSYRSNYKDVFFEDSEMFGAITQMISVECPKAKESSAWKDFASGQTIGTYEIFLPVVDTNLYVKSSSWAIPITIGEEQLRTAFRNASELSQFVSFVWLSVDNAIVQHLEDMNNLNRNGFIATKLNAQTKNVSGIHALDLVKEYCVNRGVANMTVSEFMANKDALLFATEQIALYIGYMKKQTNLFNTKAKTHFVPDDRLVVQILDYFEKRLNTVALSGTFHKELVDLPLHSTVPAWQSMADLSFDGVSSINVTVTGEDGNPVAVKRGGIIGLIADKWCIVHTTRGQRVASQRFDIENLTHYEHQFRDSYMINTGLNAVVLVLNDYTTA